MNTPLCWSIRMSADNKQGKQIKDSKETKESKNKA
jgi:hypothetical protein